MAEPILLELSPRDPRKELAVRLEQAPVDHAEALLEGYELIQSLHSAGILSLVRGLLDARDDVLEDVVEGASKPGSIRAIRNLIILAKIAESIEPEVLEKLAYAVPKIVDAVFDAQQNEPPSMLESVKIVYGANVRRGLAGINGVLEALQDSFAEENIPKHKNKDEG